jgi:hypothetical protein
VISSGSLTLKPNGAYVEIENILATLDSGGLIAFRNPVHFNGTRISWSSRSFPNWLLREPRPSVRSYSRLVAEGAYSALLVDGALLQFSLDFGQDDPGPDYRYCYWPCPGETGTGLGDSFADAIPRALSQLTNEELFQVAPIRFELDSRNYEPGVHPLSHASIGAASSRIPVRGILTPSQFMGFILRHYYPSVAEQHDEWMAIPRRRGWHQNLDELDGLPHFDWRAGRV